eukprot:1465044-Prymnesium_polylepis.2
MLEKAAASSTVSSCSSPSTDQSEADASCARALGTILAAACGNATHISVGRPVGRGGCRRLRCSGARLLDGACHLGVLRAVDDTSVRASIGERDVVLHSREPRGRLLRRLTGEDKDLVTLARAGRQLGGRGRLGRPRLQADAVHVFGRGRRLLHCTRADERQPTEERRGGVLRRGVGERAGLKHKPAPLPVAYEVALLVQPAAARRRCRRRHGSRWRRRRSRAGANGKEAPVNTLRETCEYVTGNGRSHAWVGKIWPMMRPGAVSGATRAL